MREAHEQTRTKGARRVAALFSLILAPALGALPASETSAATKSWTVSPIASRLVVTIHPAGLLAPFMRDRRLTVVRWGATFDFDEDDPSSLSLRATFDAASLRDDELDRADAGLIERHAMGPRGLDASRYPAIDLSADRLVIDGEGGATLHGWLEGELVVRGRAHPVRIAIGARWDDDWLHAMGRAWVRQSDFGIAPMRTALGLGGIDDRVMIELDLYATPDRRGR